MRSAECGVRNEGSVTSALSVRVIVNGAARVVATPLSVAGLLEFLQMPPRGLAVELNQQIVPRSQHGDVLLADGDRLEIVSLVGGG